MSAVVCNKIEVPPQNPNERIILDSLYCDDFLSEFEIKYLIIVVRAACFIANSLNSIYCMTALRSYIVTTAYVNKFNNFKLIYVKILQYTPIDCT